MEWQAYKDSLCDGCRQPRDESFSPETDGAFGRPGYDVTVLQCHACAAREKKAWDTQQAQQDGVPPPFGFYYAVSLDEGR